MQLDYILVKATTEFLSHDPKVKLWKNSGQIIEVSCDFSYLAILMESSAMRQSVFLSSLRNLQILSVDSGIDNLKTLPRACLIKQDF
jgi:hypothetical protein